MPGNLYICGISSRGSEPLAEAQSNDTVYRQTGLLLHCHADRYVLSRIVLFDLAVRRLLQRHRIGNI